MPNAHWNGEALGSGSATRRSVEDDDAEKLMGRVTRASTTYHVDVEWKNDSGSVIQTENVVSSATAGAATDISLDAKSHNADVKVSDGGSGSGNVDGVIHLA